MILGPPSVGRPLPSKILPSISCETGSLTVSPVKRTVVAETSGPDVSRTVLYSRPASETILFRLDSGRCQHFEFLIKTLVQRLGVVGELVRGGKPHAADIVLDRQLENLLEWYALVDCFLHEVVVMEDCPYHVVGFRLVTVAVGGVVGLLHEEVFLDHLRSLQDDPLSLGESVRSDEHDYLAEFFVALEKIHCNLSQVNPFRPDFLRIPGIEGVKVERVACQPVDGGEVASLGKLGVEGPEDLDDTESVLSNRFRKVSPRRRDSADDTDRALLGFRSQDL